MERIYDSEARRSRMMFHRRAQRTHHSPETISTMLNINKKFRGHSPLQSRTNLAIAELFSMGKWGQWDTEIIKGRWQCLNMRQETAITVKTGEQ